MPASRSSASDHRCAATAASRSTAGADRDAKTRRTSAALPAGSADGSVRTARSWAESATTRPAAKRSSAVARSALGPWAARADTDRANASLVALPITCSILPSRRPRGRRGTGPRSPATSLSSVSASPITPEARSIARDPDLAAQRHDRRLALGLDLRLRVRGDARGLGRRGVLRLSDDALTVGAGLLADLRRLGSRVGELGGVLLEKRLGLVLRLVGLRDVALDRLGPLIEQLPDARQRVLPEEEQDDEKTDQGTDDVRPLRDQRVAAGLRPPSPDR